MTSYTFSQQSFRPVPPQKGSFPLDHEGNCKEMMTKYMCCLKENKYENEMCREVAKGYLACRMDNGLMAREDWSKLGFSEEIVVDLSVIFDIPTLYSAVVTRTMACVSRKKVLLGCTGSVATIKLPQLVEKLWQNNLDVRVVVTERAKHFLKEAELPPGIQVLSDTVEWAAWQDRGDPVLHIDLVKWADLFLIAPLDANTLGKMASGVCDNILTCVARAWDPTKPLLFCPAMNTKMWEHPVTAPQVALLKSWGYKEVTCVPKTLMCGDIGMGGMAEVETIVQTTLRLLNPWDPYSPPDMRL